MTIAFRFLRPSILRRSWFPPVLPLLILAATAHAQGGPMRLILTGKLETGVMAVGAETTGTTLTVSSSTGKSTVYELDIKDAALIKKADELKGKQATATGTLTIKQGVEVGQRRIMTVITLEPAHEPAASQPH